MSYEGSYFARTAANNINLIRYLKSAEGEIVMDNTILDNIIFIKIIFFSFIPLAMASIMDESFSSHRDVFDAILITLVPITLMVLFKISTNEPETTKPTVEPETTQPTIKPETTRSWLTKNNLLPLLDDILYNIVTWVIPLTVSFAYDDLLKIKILSIINMCLHVACAVIALTQNKGVFYFTDNVPKGFLATSTACTQYCLQILVKSNYNEVCKNYIP
ncbi:hypothetical protein Glove_433g4 [Diversispora epigaea]|uniref:Uncharacterized protein n=1 Tax=Diversispora epigaea TaxID=1348612 RepID=A0A397GS93_9GLOM|nr:hypothetical protein Glove_433g4 [Diversispora epigaea]